MPTVTNKQLVDRIAQNHQAKHALAKATVQNLLDEIITELAKGNRLEFRDFGVFEVKEQPARTAQNPKTLERIEVPAKTRVTFKMGRIIKEKLNARVTEQ